MDLAHLVESVLEEGDLAARDGLLQYLVAEHNPWEWCAPYPELIDCLVNMGIPLWEDEPLVYELVHSRMTEDHLASLWRLLPMGLSLPSDLGDMFYTPIGILQFEAAWALILHDPSYIRYLIHENIPRVNLVQYALEQGVDPNCKDSPLIYAAKSNPVLMKLLLDWGANPNTMIENRHMFLLTENVECARLLMEYGADPTLFRGSLDWVEDEKLIAFFIECGYKPSVEDLAWFVQGCTIAAPSFLLFIDRRLPCVVVLLEYLDRELVDWNVPVVSQIPVVSQTPWETALRFYDKYPTVAEPLVHVLRQSMMRRYHAALDRAQRMCSHLPPELIECIAQAAERPHEKF
jgi:hypothetical protein